MTEDANDEAHEDEWESDHALDPPALIGIIGAGPIGIEAALYARFLGYEVIIWEAADTVGNDSASADDELVYGECVTPLGINALSAQSDSFQTLDNDASIPAQQWMDEYVLPLSRTDLIKKKFKTGATISSIVEIEEADSDSTPEAYFRVKSTDDDEWPVAAVLNTVWNSESPVHEGVKLDPENAPLTDVPGIYALGRGSWTERADDFRIRDGHIQIRKVFAAIGDRENLNLYGDLA